MHEKILVVALPIHGPDDRSAVWDAAEAASQLARVVCAHDRSIGSADLVQLPLVDGGRGTIDFLVTHTLGSFLEVEATGASGEEIVVPLGFAGEDGKLAVIEMARAAGVTKLGDAGTTAGIGELIQDALDEGAFSVLLGHEEPLACDAGLGAASALGVRFFDAKDREILFTRPGTDLSQIARVDVSGRSFALLSSRIFIARSGSAANSKPSKELTKELKRVAKIIHRDSGIHASMSNLSASAVEFGLNSFFGAEVRDGATLVLEASQITEALARGEFSASILLISSENQLDIPNLRKLLELIRANVKHRAIIVTGASEDEASASPTMLPTMRKVSDSELRYFLRNVQLFQATLGHGASEEEIRRDLGMRLDKLMPSLLEDLRGKSSAKEKSSPSRRA